MKALVAQKEYIYYYLEYMFSNIRYIEIGDRVEEFKTLAQDLDLEVLAIGQFNTSSLSNKVYSIQEFGQLYFDIRERKQVLDEEEEHLEEYCKIIEEYLLEE